MKIKERNLHSDRRKYLKKIKRKEKDARMAVRGKKVRSKAEKTKAIIDGEKAM